MANPYGDALGGRSWPKAAQPPGLTMSALTTWDGGWYLDIAQNGYPAGLDDGQSFAFFPGFPLAIRFVGGVTGVSYPTAGVAVALLAAVLLWALSRRLAGEDFADRAVGLFCFFPGSFALSMAYSEPLIRRQPEENEVLRANEFPDLDVGPVEVPMVRAPLSAIFMLPVPEASLPAVEICSERSAAGMTYSAIVTS